MYLDSLKICNVRNHKNSYFELDQGTIFVGDNGSGKTTVLESIYLLFAGKGFKKQSISNIISFDESFLRIEAKFHSESCSHETVLKYDGIKSLIFDGSPTEKVSDFIYDYPAACYTPDMLGILSASITERRNFVDRYIFYSDKSHIEDLKLYNRFLAQKLSLFEEEGLDLAYLDILNDKIVELSKRISQKRLSFLESLNLSLKEIYLSTGFNSDDIFLSYKTNINNFDILEKEKIRRRCDYGIHKDRMDMCKCGKVVEKFSSIGQKKTFLLLCLYSALINVEKKRKISIITLLDDFEATLDRRRASFLKSLFSDGRQTVFTGVENIRLDFKKIINL